MAAAHARAGSTPCLTATPSCTAATTGASGAAARSTPIWPRRRGSMVRRAAALPLLVLVGVAVTGWLYLLHPALPGPRIGLALPLDELSRHSSVSLLWYLLVWGVA